MFKIVPFVYSLNCNIVSLGYVPINANKNWCSRFLVTQTSISSWCLDAGELLRVWKCCIGYVQGHASYCAAICLFSTLGEEKLSLKFIVSNSWFRRKNIREMLYDIEGLAIWLHNSVQANKSHGSSRISMLLHSAVGWEMILDYLIGVKEVFQVEGKKEKVMFPWKTYFFPLRIFQWQRNHFIFDSIKLNISIGSLSTPEWWWYGFVLS